MGRPRNIKNQRFGRLIAIEPTKDRSHGHIVWCCKCDCGNEIPVSISNLLNGNTQSCGCYWEERCASRAIDLTGQPFGFLKVIEQNGKLPKGQYLWKCECVCGKNITVRSQDLRNGHTKSCGCRRPTGKLDLTDQTFDRLTALEPTDERNEEGSVIWRCRCICGATNVLISCHHLNTGRVRSCGCLPRDMSRERKGPKSPRWNPALTTADRKIGRKYNKYYEWRTAIFERDDYTCQTCEQHGGKLAAHHIASFEKNKKLRHTLSNGITLCANCHESYHYRYGLKNANREDFIDWLIITAVPTEHLVGKVLTKKEHMYIWPPDTPKEAPLPTRWEGTC